MTTLFIFLICAGIFGKNRTRVIKCEHNWTLKKTETIKRKLGERSLTSKSFKCTKCGVTKTKVS